MRTSRQTIPKKYKYPHELFVEVEKMPSFHDKVLHLQTHQSFAVRTILQCNFSPIIRLELPDGAPPFVRDTLPQGNSMARIERSIKVLWKIAIYYGPPSPTMNRIQKEAMFIQLLESINEKDADVILAMKEKELTRMFPSIDETLVKAAFPDLL